MSAKNFSIPPILSSELILAYAFTLIALIITVGSFLFLPPQIPLWYSLSISEQQLAPKFLIFIFPAAMVLLVFIHTLIIGKLRRMDPIIVRIFSYGTTLVIFMFLVGLGRIIYLFL